MKGVQPVLNMSVIEVCSLDEINVRKIINLKLRLNLNQGFKGCSPKELLLCFVLYENSRGRCIYQDLGRLVGLSEETCKRVHALIVRWYLKPKDSLEEEKCPVGLERVKAIEAEMQKNYEELQERNDRIGW